MKNKFISNKCLLTVVLALSLMVSSNTVVPAEEMTATLAEERSDSVSMETPIVPSADVESTGDGSSCESEDGTSEWSPYDESQYSDTSADGTDSTGDESSLAVDTSADESLETATEESSEIESTEINSEDIIFEDDIVYINPCYADVISADDLVDAPEAEAPDPSTAATVFSANNINGTIFYTTQSEAAAVIRAAMTTHSETVTLGYVTTSTDYSTEMMNIFNEALVHTGVYNEGDYLKWTYGGWKGNLSGYTSNGSHYLLFTYTITYYNTADQEAALASAVDSVFSELGIYGLGSDYEKIKTIYQFICSHVTYDYAHDSSYKLKYTAYAAMINGTSVCQGYANLLYYMSLKAGIDARFIAGTGHGGAHGWNIVRLNGLYYNLDATWDADCGSNVEKYDYFLKSDADFTGHARYENYSADAFYASYPMATESYQVQEEEPLTVSVYGHSLVLNGAIGLNFYLDFSDAAKVTAGSYVSLQNSATGASEKISIEDAVEEDGHYCFTFAIAAKEMADPIILTYYDGTTGESLCTDTSSAADYAAEQIDDGNSVSELVSAMLDYGTCAQNYFGYRIGTPANAVSNTSGTIADVDVSALAGYARAKNGTLPAGIHTYGQSLVLNDGVSIKFYYQLDEGVQISDYTAIMVSSGSSTGLEWQSSGDPNCYYVEISDVNAANLDTMYEIDVTDGTSTGSVQYGAMTYVYDMLSATEGCSDSLKNLCRSLYYYSLAADQYFAQ